MPIEPVWNRISPAGNFLDYTFNRTSMESKRHITADAGDLVKTFNRTSMESKHFNAHSRLGIYADLLTFNRTSMESKLGCEPTERIGLGDF